MKFSTQKGGVKKIPNIFAFLASKRSEMCKYVYRFPQFLFLRHFNYVSVFKVFIIRSLNSASRPTSPQSFKDSIYGTLPRSLKEQQLMVKSKLEDPEKVRERQEIVRTKSPNELAQISSISDLPLPSRMENMLKRKR